MDRHNSLPPKLASYPESSMRSTNHRNDRHEQARPRRARRDEHFPHHQIAPERGVSTRRCRRATADQPAGDHDRPPTSSPGRQHHPGCLPPSRGSRGADPGSWPAEIGAQLRPGPGGSSGTCMYGGGPGGGPFTLGLGGTHLSGCLVRFDFLSSPHSPGTVPARGGRSQLVAGSSPACRPVVSPLPGVNVVG